MCSILPDLDTVQRTLLVLVSFYWKKNCNEKTSWVYYKKMSFSPKHINAFGSEAYGHKDCIVVVG